MYISYDTVAKGWVRFRYFIVVYGKVNICYHMLYLVGSAVYH